MASAQPASFRTSAQFEMKAPQGLLLAAVAALTVSLCLASGRSLAQAPAPSSCLTIATVAQDANLTILLEAAAAANLTGPLTSRTSNLTVFAPTNEAFEEALGVLGLSSLADLLEAPSLADILLNHLTGYPLSASDLAFYGAMSTPIQTMFENEPLNVTATTVAGELMVELSTPSGAMANVMVPDIPACAHSIIHVIDSVLVPTL